MDPADAAASFESQPSYVPLNFQTSRLGDRGYFVGGSASSGLGRVQAVHPVPSFDAALAAVSS
eukprot:4857544-Prymnesium_polylepis.1